MSRRPALSGNPMCNVLSKRPGRRNAASIISKHTVTHTATMYTQIGPSRSMLHTKFSNFDRQRVTSPDMAHIGYKHKCQYYSSTENIQKCKINKYNQNKYKIFTNSKLTIKMQCCNSFSHLLQYMVRIRLHLLLL